MPLKTFEIKHMNISGLTLLPSSTNLPLISGGKFGAGKFQRPDPSQNVSALFVYTAASPPNISYEQMVTWIWIPANTDTVDVKVDLVPSNRGLDDGALKVLSDLNVEAEDVGLEDDTTLEITTDNVVTYLAVTGTTHDFVEVGETVTQAQTSLYIFDPYVAQKQSDDAAKENDGRRPYKIAAGPGHLIPVHKNITLAALIKAGKISSTTYQAVVGGRNIAIGDPNTWEFLRGVMWNDDPSSLLFDDKKDNNGSLSFAGLWSIKFKAGELVAKSPGALHAMATDMKIPASKTKEEMMVWLETMYKIAVGEFSVTTSIASTKLSRFFDNTTAPKGIDNLRTLLLSSTTSYSKPMLDRRALGTFLYKIEDSYAVGHCQRTITNRLDMTRVTFDQGIIDQMKFWKPKPLGRMQWPANKPGRFGQVDTFHTYKGQDEDRHALYDKPPKGSNIDARNPASFGGTVGALDAIDQCTGLIQFWGDKTPWSPKVQEFLDTKVFGLVSPNNQSNTKVDD